MKYKNEQELYLDLLNNRDSAFKYIYSSFRIKAINFICQKGGSREEAKDVFQEAVIAMWQNIQDGKFNRKPGAKLSTYLLQICKFKWYDRLKSGSMKNELALDEELDIEDESNALKDLISGEYIASAQKIFSKLGENCQEILSMFYYEDLSMDQIAEKIGTKVTSATNQKYRCMQRLKTFNNKTLKQES